MRTRLRTYWTTVLAILAVFTGIVFETKANAAGRTENEVRYNAKNEVIKGTYAEPERDGYRFIGWATTKERADAGIVDIKDDKPNDLTNEALSKIGGGTGSTNLYAVWKQKIYKIKWGDSVPLGGLIVGDDAALAEYDAKYPGGKNVPENLLNLYQYDGLEMSNTTSISKTPKKLPPTFLKKIVIVINIHSGVSIDSDVIRIYDRCTTDKYWGNPMSGKSWVILYLRTPYANYDDKIDFADVDAPQTDLVEIARGYTQYENIDEIRTRTFGGDNISPEGVFTVDFPEEVRYVPDTADKLQKLWNKMIEENSPYVEEVED